MQPICPTCGATKTRIAEDREPAHLNWRCESDICNQLRNMEMPETRTAFNIRTLQRQNREGKTTREEEREALGDRWNDPRVGRAN